MDEFKVIRDALKLAEDEDFEHPVARDVFGFALDAVDRTEEVHHKLREAVFQYLAHRHAQFEWRCDESECVYYMMLKDAMAG